MRQSMHLFTFVLVSVIAFSCSDSNVPVNQASSENDAGSLLKPSSSGPFVIRSQTTFAMFIIDERRGISASIGADPREFCNGNINFDIVELLQISVPQDANRLIEITHGNNVQITVWPFTIFDCTLFASTTPLATGVVDVVSTDNDLLAFLNPPTPYHNAFGFHAHGVLTNAEGQPVQFNGHGRYVWDGVDLSSLRGSEVIILN